eukprot:scaffold149_cov383-Prasinococcus_capsulatus_cf.AAC.14
MYNRPLTSPAKPPPGTSLVTRRLILQVQQPSDGPRCNAGRKAGCHLFSKHAGPQRVSTATLHIPTPV